MAPQWNKEKMSVMITKRIKRETRGRDGDRTPGNIHADCYGDTFKNGTHKMIFTSYAKRLASSRPQRQQNIQ